MDPRIPLFFLSYAHSRRAERHGPQREPNQRFIDFFDDLSEDVAQLVGRPPGSDPGYMDRSMTGGVRWTEELLTAIGSCQVFVALLSDPYIESPWCGMEWHAFSQRPIRRHLEAKAVYQTGIIPVLWAPVAEERIPQAVSDVQRFFPRGLPDPDIAAHYEKEGVLGLLELGLDDGYRAVVWRLAQRIADFLRHHRVVSRTVASDELRNIFREAGS